MRPVVEAFHHEPTGSYTYVVSDPVTRRAAIVDPVLDFDAASGRTGTAAAERVAAHIERERLGVDWILETHVHADHLTAAPYLRARCGGRVGIGTGVRDVQAHCRALFNLEDGFRTDGSQFDALFADGESFAIGGLEGRVIATPGHTSDGITYLVGDAAFVGDTLFAPDVGSARCDFPGGSARTLYASIRRLYALPGDTRLFLCHDYPPAGRRAARCEASVAEQRDTNVHVRGDTTEDAFVALREARDAKLGLPRLMYPAIQVNVRAGALPPPEGNGARYLKIPLTAPARD
jgi:glyoxylase-like metal-dependent hydrolase (beta-lactamase superfamily II)